VQEQLISFQTAKLAKEKGVDFNVEKIYDANGILVTVFADKSFIENNNWYLAPTQSLLQKWLREEHNIHIEISYDYITYDILISYPDNVPIKLISLLGDNSKYTFTKYEEALEEGLQKALKLI